MNEDLYKEYILDVFKNLKHKKENLNANLIIDAYNSSCGDRLKLFINIEKDRVTSATFTGEGCLLSQVSTEILLGNITNKDIESIKTLTIESLEELIGIHPTPARSKCMKLSFTSLKKNLTN